MFVICVYFTTYFYGSISTIVSELWSTITGRILL